MKKILMAICLMALIDSANAEKKEIPLKQADSRFTLTAEKSWSGQGSETYFFYVQNNTSDEYKIVISVTLDLVCVGTKSFDLGYNHVVYLEPNGNFNARDDDNDHGYNSGADNFENCRLRDGNSFTLFKGIQYSISSIENLTQQKALAEKKKNEADELKQLEDKKKKDEELAKAAPSSYYSTQPRSNVNTNSSDTRKPTWEETNARINAENQQKYAEQRNRIAEQERVNRANSDQFVNDAADLVNMVSDIFSQASEEKEKKALKAKQEQERARQAEQERLNEIARKKELRLELRNSFFSEFQEGGIPLSSQKMPVTELFYFTYLFDRNTIEEDLPVIALSNVFPVSQYGDGTWPFKSSLLNDIRKSCSGGTITLIGYYTTKELAEQMRSSFLEIANKSKFTIKDIAYKGKQSTTTGNNDFWGTGNKSSGNSNDSLGRAKMRMAKGDEDFWETGQAKKKMATEEKKPVKDNDFWNK